MRKLIVITGCWIVWYVVAIIENICIFSAISRYPLVTCWHFIQGNDMDSSRGVLSGTMDKFKMVCELSCLLCSIHLLSFPFLLIRDSVSRCGRGIVFSSPIRIQYLFVFFFFFSVSSFRYLKQNPAEECFLLQHPLLCFFL